MGQAMTNPEFQQAVRDLDRRLQKVQNEVADARKVLALVAHSETAAAVPPPDLAPAAFVNGRRLTDAEFTNLHGEDYDVVLNCVDRILLSKDRPGTRSKLTRRDCMGLGPHQMTLLRYMLEHPDQPICMETIHMAYGDDPNVTNAALVKAISRFRGRLGKREYIMTDHDYGMSLSGTGHVYLMNPAYRYLVIRYAI